MTRLVVVGAGITGLAAAFEWRRRRPDDEIVVLEAGDRIGGKLHRVELAGHWYDTGPEAVLARVPEAVRLVEDLGLGDRLVAPATTQASVVLPDGRHRLPAGTVLGVPASADDVAGFLSDDGVARVRAEASLPPVTLDGDVAVGALLRDRLGDEVVDRLVEPLLGGVYAGRADELSLTATMPALAAQLGRGSVLAAATAARDAGTLGRGDDDGPVFATVSGGIGSLPQALVAASRAEVRLRTPASALRRTTRGFELSIGPAAAPEILTADRVLVTAPAPKAARLLRDVAPGAVEPLSGIPYASMAVVATAFPAQEVDAGSGLLVPPVTGRLVKGVTVSSAKWPHLAGGGALLVRSSVGRFRDEAELQRSDDDLTAAVVADVADLLGLARPEPLETRLVRWGGGLPQYLVGHPRRVDAIRAAVSEVPGLAIAGAAFRGVGVPACIRDAHHALDALR